MLFPSKLTAVSPSEMLKEKSRIQAGMSPTIAGAGPSPRLCTALRKPAKRNPKMMKMKTTGITKRMSCARSRVRMRQSLITIDASTGLSSGSAPVNRGARNPVSRRRRGGTAWIHPAR